MSENLLKSLIELFAILAKEDSVTEDERKTIENFLRVTVSDKVVGSYMDLFDELSQKASNGEYSDEMGQIMKICQKINLELTQQQKYVLILELIELIVADGEISEGEMDILVQVGKAIKVRPETVENIQHFVIARSQKGFHHENILVISPNSDEVSSACHKMQESRLQGILAILKLEGQETYFIKYIGKQYLTLNGVAMRNNAVSVFSAGSTVRGDVLGTLFYSDLIGHFKEDIQREQVSFEAREIHFRFPNGNIGLHKVDIAEERGKLVGLMGASGSGKSTLLNVLNGNEKPTDGSVLINGIDIHQNPKKVEGLIGYVPQDDLLIEELTVYQNLYFAAKLCFSHKSEKELDKLVHDTLQSLGLLETRDLKVGSPLQKTISGGQRKRLNIGLELLREPSVLFVDEPTSGLSSRDSENIMDLLKELSLKGKMVFVVIHQPSSDIFKMFDKLVILDKGGYQIYYGNPVEAVTYFKDQINAVDKDQGACVECGNVNPEQIFNIIETRVVNEYGRITDERRISPQRWNTIFDETTKPEKITPPQEMPHPDLKIPSWLRQIGIFFKRDFLSKLANRQYLLINLLEAPLLAGILAYIVRYYPHDQPGYSFFYNLNIPAFFFMSIIVALFMGLTMSAEEIFKDRKILKREAFLHLSKSSYLFSKMAILFLFSALQTLMFVVIGDFILNIESMSVMYWVILFSVSCFANLLGLNISSAFDSAITIYILIPLLLIPQLILSGVVVQFDNLNPKISQADEVPLVGELMASRWAFEAAMVAQFKDNAYNKIFYPLEKTMGNAEYKSVYMVPNLQNRLDYLKDHLDSLDTQGKQNLHILHNMINQELALVGREQFTQVDQLNEKQVNASVLGEAGDFLNVLKRFYNNQYNNASNKKERLLYYLSKTPEKKATLDYLKSHYDNEAVDALVKNTASNNRLLVMGDELVRKIYPVFMEPNPDHWFDFRTQFFVGQKYFGGYLFNTVYFNIVIIWVMSLMLYGLLYYDVLRKVINFRRKA